MGRLSTHVLDTARGRPAQGVAIALDRIDASGARVRIVSTATNADGRTDAPLLAGEALAAGGYELTFAIGPYFRAAGLVIENPAFLEIVPIRFHISDPDGHYHVPLVCSPYSYATYRGS